MTRTPAKVAGLACQLAVNAGPVESGHMEGNLILSYEVWTIPTALPSRTLTV